ncbi:hypothetical protein E2A64_09210 [Pseudohoeflea suaedae]|uniref:MAE-28990/MAE-18760-like HEPN domain-containing protein n=1 Tax=Pseudohoeflea suaedae TaxID=877384 RepID=A0A4R5PQ46_9HYPH|nr:hypothetical protein [Pseudohoeflea suaedae]TDH39226.1 hypothetical protein E2A64_09210 [Pseudohoeflea suaedae]
MCRAQLEKEYEGMVERHELYAKFGITAEAAQLFETELGTLVLALEGLKNDWHTSPDPNTARKVLDRIDRSTLGRTLVDLRQYITFEANLEKCFSSALKSRNLLMHGFFERHSFKIQTDAGRREMIADLKNLHEELFVAWQAASKLTAILMAAISHRTDGQ